MKPAVVTLAAPPGYVIKELSSMSAKDRPTVAEQVARLERKIFPSNESFDYDVELRKKNTGLFLAVKADEPGQVVGYLVHQRMKRLVWLHKLCVIELQRKNGIGRALINALRYQMENGGGESIQLWVDEHRSPARALYESYGFQQIDYRADYYAQGRAGLRMEFKLHS